MGSVRKKRSRLLRGYGAVLSVQKPEDFRMLREAFEKGVAEDVIASFNRPGIPVNKEHIDNNTKE